MTIFTIEKIPSDVLIEVAEKIRRLRKARKLSQEELANRAKVSLGSYKRFERTGMIAFDSLLRIAFILGKLEDFDNLFLMEAKKPSEKLFL